MIKYLVAAAMLITPTAANAQTVFITLNRLELIREASKTICRAAMERPGAPSKIVKEESAYLSLTQDEELYLLSLCILYAQGRADQK